MKRTRDRWRTSFRVPRDSRIEYQFIVDGQWIQDPAHSSQVENGVGSFNSVYVGPQYRISVKDETPKHPLVRRTFMVQNRPFVVFAPADSRGLPLLVFADGDTYESIGKIQNIVANLIDAGKIRAVTLVLVPPVDRLREFGPDWKNYADLLFKGVLPTVRSATGASSNPRDLFLGGSSMGGVISLRLAEIFPNLVGGGILTQSAALAWSPLNLNYREWGSAANLSEIALTTKIWMDWGSYEGDLTKANEAAAANLKQMGRKFRFKVTHEGHNWTAWRNRVEAGLIYLLGTQKG